MYRLSGRAARSSFLDFGRPAAERSSSSSARIRRMDVIRWALPWDLSKRAWRGTGSARPMRQRLHNSPFDGRPGIDQGVSVPVKPEQPVPARPMPGKAGAGHQIAALLGSLGLSHTVSFLGSLVIIANAHGWYAAANKAPWTPPDWVFGTVWTLLYTAMAVAAWLVWRRRSDRRRVALSAYAVQLALNLAWIPTFFGMYPMLGSAALWLALLIIAALALCVGITVLRFGPISRTAGLLMLPYISWIVFSASLNLYAATTN
jgi:translocator protein